MINPHTLVNRADLKDKEQKTKEQAELDKLKKQIDEAKKEVNKIKNSKLVLGKAPENLSEAQIEKVKFATETDASLHKAYDLNVKFDKSSTND